MNFTDYAQRAAESIAYAVVGAFTLGGVMKLLISLQQRSKHKHDSNHLLVK
jgi:hypothetical protein